MPSTLETWANATSLHVAPRELGVQLLQRKFAALVDLQVAQRGAALAAQHLPGHDVGVVLELGDQDRVAGADVRPPRDAPAPPGVGDEVDRLGDVLREHRRPRLGAHERGDPPARAVIGRVGLLRERVDAAVDVGVVRAQMLGQRVDHDRGLLRGRARVEVDQLTTVEAAGEDREIALHAQG